MNAEAVSKAILLEMEQASYLSPLAEITPCVNEVVSIHVHVSATADSKKIYSDWSIISAPASMSITLPEY